MNGYSEDAVHDSGPKGIGGWLILHVIGLTLGPILHIVYGIRLIFIMTGSSWSRLTDPASVAYDSFWKPALVFEFVSHVIFSCYLITLAILFFKKSRLFPRLIIVLFLLYAVFSIGDFLLCRQIAFIAQNQRSMGHLELGIVRALLICIVWVPYFSVSKRVKNTFVE